MPEQLVQRETMRFTPSTLINLYILDGRNIGLLTPFYFCDGNSSSFAAIVFNGISYTPFPIISTKFGFDGTGKPVRPTLTASNINGFVSQLLLQNQNLIGAKFIRRRVFARFIDASNWPNNKNPYGTPDVSAAYPDEVWYVNRKITENQQIVEWELASLFETDNIKLPRRQIVGNVCGFKYRDPNTCQYLGVPLADKNNKFFVGGSGTYGFSALINRGPYDPNTGYSAGDYVTIFSNLPQYSNIPVYYVCLVAGLSGNLNSPINNPNAWAADACPRSIAGCKIRFPAPTPLRGGFFPGVTQAPYIAGGGTIQ